MPFRVTIEELFYPPFAEAREPVKRMEVTVDVIDMPNVVAAINKPPRKPRVRKPKE